MSITTDLAGRELAGRYRLVATLGRGSFAVVYLAEDLRLSRRVAVKLLHPGLATDETFARRFRTEAELLAGLNHPHVLSVFDWGEEGDDAFLVTEYLAGGSLAQLLRSGVRLGIPEATALGAKVAHGLAHAHRHGLVHRDIKPANLLFDEAGEVRVADFGIARAIAEAATTTPEGTLVGTARYASPEQAEARSLDGRSDVYSLALVLYEAVVGSVPFVGETDAATLLRRVGAKLPPSRELGALYPVLVQAAISDPLARLDAAEFALELELLARTLPAPSPLPIAPPKVEFAENPAARLAPPVATDEDDDLTVVGGVLALPVAGSRAAGADATVTAVPQSSPPTAKVPVGVGGSGTRVADGGLFDQGADPGVVDDPPTVVAPPAAPDGPRPPRAHRGPWIFAIVAIVVVLLAGSGAVVYRFVLYGHHVPGLTGLSTTGARKAVNRSGLALKIGGSTYSATIPVGEILTQTPASGTALRSGATVTVTLSLGVKPVTVPSVVGQGRKAAVNALVAGNLKPVVTTANSETVPRGRVISETPSSGTEAPGTAIALQISLGPAPRTIPQFANATYAAAAASLQALRLVPSEQQAYSTTVASGDVISTTPAEGATGVRVGTTVVVTVSKGPQMVAIPPVAGTSVTAAVAALRAAGLVVAEVIGPPFATMAVTTNPAPGTPVQVGSSVTLYAATG